MTGTGFGVYISATPDPANAIVQTLVDTIKRERFVAGYRASDAEAFGLLMAGFFDHDSRILEAAASALEDANFHTESGQVKDMHEALVRADDDQPYDDSMRRALFARLGEVYGKQLDRGERLARLSKLVNRQVYTMSLRTAKPITVGEFHRAMELLDTLK